MEKELTILLVEDEQSECDEIAAYVDTLDDISLIGVADRSDTALELIQDRLPDSVILDLELHYGSGNGLTLLHQYEAIEIGKAALCFDHHE